MSRRTHHKHDTAPLSLYNWHTITLCLVSDRKAEVRKFSKSDGQTGSWCLDKAVLAQGEGVGVMLRGSSSRSAHALRRRCPGAACFCDHPPLLWDTACEGARSTGGNSEIGTGAVSAQSWGLTPAACAGAEGVRSGGEGRGQHFFRGFSFIFECPVSFRAF